MPTAKDQIQLLELQGLDNKLGDLKRKKQTDPSIAAVAEISGRLVDLQASLVQANTAVSDADREALKAHGAVTEVQNRIQRNQKRLDSGELTPKDTIAVAEEMGTLANRLDKLEDEYMVVMERQEACQLAGKQITNAIADMQKALQAAEVDRDNAIAAIVAEGRAVIAERDKIAGGIDQGLLSRYDSIRRRLGGVAAVRLWGGKCEGCQLQLPPGDLDVITNTPADQIVLCEECGRILIRVPQ